MTELVEAIAAAAERIAAHVRRTPVELSPVLAERAGSAAPVWLKLENQQRTGSFKLRGALNTLLSLPASERARGVVAASSGNHGAGVACAAALTGCRAVVFMPAAAPAHKATAIAAYGAEVQRFGDDCVLTEQHARAFAAEHGLTYVSPYNDLRVVAGQGTLGVELDAQLEDLDTLYVAVGGGGLIAGLGSYLRARRPGIEIVACSPRNSAVMHESLRAGRILDLPSTDTLSDATAGGIEPGAVTFALCQEVVTRSLTVSEVAIAAALRLVLEHHHALIEGAAACAVAGYLTDRQRRPGATAAILLCGANIGPDALRAVLEGGAPT